jgi:ribulose bisphosphate carboxylase small subunit
MSKVPRQGASISIRLSLAPFAAIIVKILEQSWFLDAVYNWARRFACHKTRLWTVWRRLFAEFSARSLAGDCRAEASSSWFKAKISDLER